MIDTPRTDAAAWGIDLAGGKHQVVFASLARELERELAEARRSLASEPPGGRLMATTLKPDKGQFAGSCNRTACQAPDATWWHMDTRAYYCEPCAYMLNTMHAAEAQRIYGGPLLREHEARGVPKCTPVQSVHLGEKP